MATKDIEEGLGKLAEDIKFFKDEFHKGVWREGLLGSFD